MNKIKWMLIGIAALTLTSCGHEDELTPSGAKENHFAVEAIDTVGNPTNALRYEFYKDHKIYLFFNDTVRKEARGTYADGTTNWFVEMLDIDFSIESNGYSYNYEYSTDLEEQKKCIAILENHIIPHIGKFGDPLYPYSFLVVKEMKRSGKKTSYVYNKGMRCLALNLGKVLQMDDEEEIAEYCKEKIFYAMIYAILEDLDDDPVLNEFYAFCSPYYNKKYTNIEINGKNLTEKPKKETFMQLGFLDGGSESTKTKFCYDSDDLVIYMKALFFWDEEESFESVYKDYAVILQKYALLKGLIEDTYGYKF